ncbi:MAG: OB-fold domain-containing protein [Collinsella sp.]
MSSAVVDVSGVGFELGISGSTAATLPTPGGEVRLYTRMQVREDAMTLFGLPPRTSARCSIGSCPSRALARAWRLPCFHLYRGQLYSW